MIRFLSGAAVTCAVLSGCASQAWAQSDFQWRGSLAGGQSIEIKGVNGEIRAVGTSASDVAVAATRSARRSNPSDVRFEVVPHSGGVTICAVYPDVPGEEPNRCQPGSGGRSSVRNNDTVVHFTVQVPPGVALIARTVNGQIEGDSLRGDAEGYTVNGSVRLSTTGRALASTVNGSITASMGRADWQNGAKFATVNGGITLNLPAALNAELIADFVHGSVTSDFPVTVSSLSDRQHLRGTIGSGGAELRLTTVNGSINLRKAQ